LGLCIPPLLMIHMLGTRVGEELLNINSDYVEILVLHWIGSEPRYLWTQTATVLAVWAHASIGIHFWLRTKRWYPSAPAPLAVLAILIPALALAGYVAAGNQIVRDAEEPGYVRSVLDEADFTSADGRIIHRWADIGFVTHFILVGLTFGA